MKTINTNVEHLLINSSEFTSSIVNWKKYIQNNIYVLLISANVSKVFVNGRKLKLVYDASVIIVFNNIPRLFHSLRKGIVMI